MRHRSWVKSASFSPDGTLIVTVCADHTAQVWDAVDGKPMGEPMRHKDEINSASFSPDGTRVVTASDDKTAQMWDAVSGRPLGEPMQHDALVRSASFSPDGTRVVTASWDSTVKVWDVAIAGRVSPPWLATLDEWSAGQRFGLHNVMEPVEREKLRSELETQAKSLPPNDDPQGRWLRWFLADRGNRTISPLSDETMSEYMQKRVDSESVNAATQPAFSGQ
jgi:hypothetical protein